MKYRFVRTNDMSVGACEVKYPWWPFWIHILYTTDENAERECSRHKNRHKVIKEINVQ